MRLALGLLLLSATALAPPASAAPTCVEDFCVEASSAGSGRTRVNVTSDEPTLSGWVTIYVTAGTTVAGVEPCADLWSDGRKMLGMPCAPILVPVGIGSVPDLLPCRVQPRIPPITCTM